MNRRQNYAVKKPNDRKAMMNGILFEEHRLKD